MLQQFSHLIHEYFVLYNDWFPSLSPIALTSFIHLSDSSRIPICNNPLISCLLFKKSQQFTSHPSERRHHPNLITHSIVTQFQMILETIFLTLSYWSIFKQITTKPHTSLVKHLNRSKIAYLACKGDAIDLDPQRLFTR